MKKTIAIVFAMTLMLLCTPAFAQGEVAGHIYSTDILTFVNGKPMEGFNIGGKTVVIAEDLTDYGFGYTYNDETRTLSVTSFFHRGIREFEEIPRGTTGKVVGDVYKTNIKVYFNGIPVEGYNIGGRTAICLETLGEVEGSPNAQYGYSEYLGKSIWNPEEKTISFESYLKNEDEILGRSRVYHSFRDNVIYTYSDDFCARSEFTVVQNGEYTVPYEYTEAMKEKRYSIQPLYFDNHGELMEIGLCVDNPNNDRNDALMHIYDPVAVKNMIKTFKAPGKSHDKAVAYFNEMCTNVKTIENDNFTVLMGEHETKGILCMYVNKQGGFVLDSFMSYYADRQLNFYFDEFPVNSGPNTVNFSVYPFGGPHGTTTANFVVDLDDYDYE
ncbi:MAG: hypothetical protein E7403_06215 [Ruminococcaceae bacterium]|nr:hypothetical protein [Oscillospiraceae bacterium]